MAKVTAVPQTKVLETLEAAKESRESLAKVIGRASLGSPINGKNVGDSFPITLTGKVEIREYNGTKGAYFTTKEGYSIKVNASFDPAIHVEGATFTAVCKELVTENADGSERKIKFTAFED